jgi:fucose permease
MMSIFILIGAYRYYAGLAERFGKTKWHFGLLAIAIYLGFQVMFLFSYGIYQGLTHTYNENNYTGFSLINIISWLLAIGAVYGVYKLLENRFQKENSRKPSVEIEKIGQNPEI